MTKKIKLILIVLVFIAIGAWRGWGLWYRGLLEHDEGHALLNANTYRSVLVWVLEGGPFGGQASLAHLRDALHQGGGTLYSAGKSGYGLLLALAGLPGNVSQAQALFLAWVAGIIVLAASACITYLWFGKQRLPVVITVAGLSFSPLIGTLSREVSGTIWALALGLAGLALLTWSEAIGKLNISRLMRLGGGALIGYGFTCHFNLAPFVLAAFASHAIFLGVSRNNERTTLKSNLLKLSQALLASAFVLAAFQGATWLADKRLARDYPEYLSFLGELHRLFFSDQIPRIQTEQLSEGVMGWGIDAWAYYGAIGLREGPALIILLFTSILLLVFGSSRYSRRLLLPPFALFAIPAAFWMLYPFKIERVLGMCVAPAWILAGGGLQAMWQAVMPRQKLRTRKNMLITAALVVGLAHVSIVTYYGWVSLWRQRSPLNAVAHETLAYTEKNGGLITAGSFNTGFAPIWKWAIIEEFRTGKYAKAPTHVDFSRFEGATIVFVDPATWRNSSAEFNVSQQQIANAHQITLKKSDYPQWNVSAYDLDRPK